MCKSVVDVCVCVCEHLWLQSGLVCGASVSVWVKGVSVKGVWILETQKRGPEINPKWWGSRSDLHSARRSHANNARLLCLECQLKEEHAYRRRFLFSSVLTQTVSNRKNLVCL